MRRIILIASLLFVQPANAKDDEEDRKIVYKQKTEIDFQDLSVEAALVKPQGILTIERKQASFNPLIKLRKDFNQEMDQSVQEIKQSFLLDASRSPCYIPYMEVGHVYKYNRVGDEQHYIFVYDFKKNEEKSLLIYEQGEDYDMAIGVNVNDSTDIRKIPRKFWKSWDKVE